MRLLRHITVLVAVIVIGVGTAAAQATKRVALVIANASYDSYRGLPNADVDADLVKSGLERAGFQVDVRKNRKTAEMRADLAAFQTRASGSQVALVYFAGHGIEAGGRNWLIPTDTFLENDAELDFKTIDANLIIQATAGARVRMIVLDACRNNPLAARMRQTGTYKITRDAISGGLGGVSVQSTRGTLLMYSAAAGETSDDGTPGQGSPFARAFSRWLPEPNVELRIAVGKIADAVFADTGQTQLPFTTTSLSGEEFYLVPRTNPVAAVPATVVNSTTQRELDEARRQISDLQARASAPAVSHTDVVRETFQHYAGAHFYVEPAVPAKIKTGIESWLPKADTRGVLGVLEETLFTSGASQNMIVFYEDRMLVRRWGVVETFRFADMKPDDVVVSGDGVDISGRHVFVNYFEGQQKRFAQMLKEVAAATRN